MRNDVPHYITFRKSVKHFFRNVLESATPCLPIPIAARVKGIFDIFASLFLSQVLNILLKLLERFVKSRGEESEDL